MLAAALVVCAASEQQSVELLSATDPAQLKEVFFSGNPWLVQCGTKADISAAIVDGGFGAHAVVEKAVPQLPKDVKVGLLDCYRKLPSGKTTIDRFKLDNSVSPLLVLAANGKTQQITGSMLNKHGLAQLLFPTTRQQAGALASFVKHKSDPKAYSATSSEHIQSLCLKRKHCAIVLMDKEPRGETARALHAMLYEFRAVSFVTINTARYEFSLAKHLPTPEKGAPQMVAMRSQPSADGDKRKVSIGAKAHRGAFTASALREFLSSLVAEELQMTPLKKIPTMRWRKQDKGDKGSSGGGSGGSGGGSGGSSKGTKQQQQARREAPRMGGGRQAPKGAKYGNSKAAKGGKAPPTAEQLAEQRERENARREQMMAEEDEALRSMFADADEDDEDDDEEAGGAAGGDSDGDDSSDDDGEVVDFDEESGGGSHDEL